MTGELVHYALEGRIATITIDDGKRNALSPELLGAIGAALERAEKDEALVILTGREEVFSAGFDLKVMRGGGVRAVSMLNAGFSMTARMLNYPYPIIVACNGHALAMGLFLVLSADYRFGVRGDFKYAANEVAIGIPLPRTADLVLRMRLKPADFQRAAILGEYFSPEQAEAVGIIDRLVDPDALMDAAQAKAEELLAIDMPAHTLTKRRVRGKTIRAIQRAVPRDLRDAVMLGVQKWMNTKRG